MFLDYDGTLSPIVERPDEAFMSDDMRAAVKRVSAIFTTIVVSGRAKDKVRNFIDLDENLMYAGSHGFDIAGPGGLAYQVGTRFLPLLSEAFALLSAAVAAIPGASVENNRFSVTVHWRLVDESRVAEVEALTREVLATQGGDLEIRSGKKVFEVRPNLKWDKGEAVKWLLSALSWRDAEDVIPFYLGDDTTDEDAFHALKCDVGRGVGILVSDTPETRATEVRLLWAALRRWSARRSRPAHERARSHWSLGAGALAALPCAGAASLPRTPWARGLTPHARARPSPPAPTPSLRHSLARQASRCAVAAM
jgi:trehalose 6-phosphate phosphatase